MLVSASMLILSLPVLVGDVIYLYVDHRYGRLRLRRQPRRTQLPRVGPRGPAAVRLRRRPSSAIVADSVADVRSAARCQKPDSRTRRHRPGRRVRLRRLVPARLLPRRHRLVPGQGRGHRRRAAAAARARRRRPHAEGGPAVARLAAPLRRRARCSSPSVAPPSACSCPFSDLDLQGTVVRVRPVQPGGVLAGRAGRDRWAGVLGPEALGPAHLRRRHDGLSPCSACSASC